MYEEINALAEQFCQECFEDVTTCGWDITVAKFIEKVTNLMRLKAASWNVEEEE